MIKYNYDSVELNCIAICSKVAYLKTFILDIKNIDEKFYNEALMLKDEMNKWAANILNNKKYLKIKSQIDWDNCWHFINTLIYNYRKWE
jgi:hypothetical protein